MFNKLRTYIEKGLSSQGYVFTDIELKGGVITQALYGNAKAYSEEELNQLRADYYE